MNHMLAQRKPGLVDNQTPHSRKEPHVVVSDLLAVPYHWLPHNHTHLPGREIRTSKQGAQCRGVRGDSGCGVQHQARDTPLQEDTLERVAIEEKSDNAMERLLHFRDQELFRHSNALINY
jgi:hypothetical protein